MIKTVGIAGAGSVGSALMYEMYQKDPDNVYLVATGERVMAVIRQSDGCSNKELAKFADQLDSLCEKFLKY